MYWSFRRWYCLHHQGKKISAQEGMTSNQWSRRVLFCLWHLPIQNKTTLWTLGSVGSVIALFKVPHPYIRRVFPYMAFVCSLIQSLNMWPIKISNDLWGADGSVLFNDQVFHPASQVSYVELSKYSYFLLPGLEWLWGIGYLPSYWKGCVDLCQNMATVVWEWLPTI